jgi:FkbM family methyltransferase
MYARERGIEGLAKVTRRWQPKGIDRLVRLVHPPDNRPWSVKAVRPLPGGELVTVDTASFIEWRVYFYGTHEPSVDRLIRQHVAPDSVAIDVGANVGMHTVAMAGCARHGQVLALEPNPRVFDKLVSNIALNRYTHVHAVNSAASNAAGELILNLPPANAGNQGTARVAAGLLENRGAVKVPAVTLDSQVASEGFRRVDFVKIDVEGWEARVLAGARDTLATYRPALVFEFLPSHWAIAHEEIYDAFRLLRECGYRHFYDVTTAGLREIQENAKPSSTDIFATD